MKPAPVSLLALIATYKKALALAGDWRSNRCARAARLAAIIGGMILFTGCGARELPALPQAPVVLAVPECPAPARPVLPVVDGTLPLDSSNNAEALLERDDTLRAYIKGLEATTACYKGKK